MADDVESALRRIAYLVRSRRDQLRLDRVSAARKVGVPKKVLCQIEHNQAHFVPKKVVMRVIRRLKFPPDRRSEVYRLVPIFLIESVPTDKVFSGRQLTH